MGVSGCWGDRQKGLEGSVQSDGDILILIGTWFTDVHRSVKIQCMLEAVWFTTHTFYVKRKTPDENIELVLTICILKHFRKVY